MKYILFLLTLLFPQFATAQTNALGIVINEIYIGTVRSGLANDSFIELYNPTDHTLYLDGCILARFDSSGGLLSGGVLSKPAEGWIFPGSVGGHTLSVTSGSFVVIAVNATATAGGIDLSGADFETYSSLIDNNSPSSKKLRKLGGNAFFNVDFALSQTHDAVVITDGLDTVITDGLKASSILDGVQYAVGGTGNLPATIDAGITGGANLKLGVSMERNEKGVTTHNSFVDFSLQTKPSPGLQHGAKIDNTKATEIFPLDLGHYNIYDAYTTDTLGVPIDSTKNRASFVVWRTGQNFSGSTNVAWAKDTSNITNRSKGQENNLHYLPNVKGDILAYADAQFLGTFVPQAFATILTPPDSFVNYFILSGGVKKQYAITHLAQQIDFQGTTVSIDLTVTGSYQGIDSVTVPAGHFDTAYKFFINGAANISLSIIPLGSFSGVQTIWLVKGIGIVKTNLPTINGIVPIAGSERQLTKYGVEFIDAVPNRTDVKSQFTLFPNPSNDAVALSITDAAINTSSVMRVELHSIVDGQRKVVYNGAPRTDQLILTNFCRSGSYLVSVFLDDALVSSQKLVVVH